MTRDEAAPPPGDLLLQAVEGMERPLFVLDDDWRFSYMNPAGRRRCWASGRRPRRPGHLGEVPARRSAARSRSTTAGSRRPGEPASFEAWFDPLQIWFQVDAFRTDAGLVVTYDDVTERRRTEEERAAADRRPRGGGRGGGRAAAEAEEAGRHLMLLGDINLAMTSTLDTDEAVQRFADLVVPLLADWCIVTVVDPDGTRRDVGRAHRDPALVEAMHRYADLRVADQRRDRTGAPHAPRPQAGGLPGAHRRRSSRSMVPDEEAREALAPLRPAAAAGFPLVARGEVIGGFTLVNGPERGRAHRGRSCGRRRSPPAGRRSRSTTPGSPRPTSRSPSGCS